MSESTHTNGDGSTDSESAPLDEGIVRGDRFERVSEGEMLTVHGMFINSYGNERVRLKGEDGIEIMNAEDLVEDIANDHIERV